VLAYWPLRDRLTYVYFNVFSNNVNKKMAKKALFLATDCTDYTDRRQKTPGRETEKPAQGVNSRADGREKENIEYPPQGVLWRTRNIE
jgi:hypothetical protein